MLFIGLLQRIHDMLSMSITVIGMNCELLVSDPWCFLDGNIFRFTGPLRRESTGHQWIIKSLFLSLVWNNIVMMTSSNGNIVRVTGPLWGESTGHRWIPLIKACDAELWCLLWSAPEQNANNRDAGDLRRQRAHYDITVIHQEWNGSA